MLKKRISGVERYAHEVVDRIAAPLSASLYKPERSELFYQHFWEQIVLPVKLKGRPLLFNPCNLAPVGYRRNVVVIHDVIPFLYPQFYSSIFSRYYKGVLPLLGRHAVHILTVSEFSRRQIVKYLGVNEKKVSVVYNGVSERFSPGARALEQSVRSRYNLDRPYLLYIGSLEPRKDVKTLLNAFAFAQRELKLTGHALVIVGNGHPNFSAPDYSRDNSRDVKFLGYVDDQDLPALYAAAELFVYPSLCEGFGLPVLEAMACGTPALAASGSSLEEIVRQKDLLFPPGNHKILAEKIVALLADCRLRKSLSQKCLEEALLFSWAETARNTVKILDGLA